MIYAHEWRHSQECNNVQEDIHERETKGDSQECDNLQDGIHERETEGDETLFQGSKRP